MKKIFTLFLVLVATTALWAHNFSVGGIYYNILTDKTNEVEVTFRGSDYNSYSNEYSGSVTIPSTVTYNGTTYSVTSIGESAFDGCTGLTSITIPNSVTSIGDYAFYDCSGLTSIIVEEGNSIYDSRENCNAIIETNSNTLVAGCKNTTIPNSVTSIGDGAFGGCSGLTSITIPNSVTSIGDYAFYWCSGLTSVTIPNSVTSIGSYAFSNCSGLTSPVYNAHCFAYMPTSYRGAYAIPEGIKQIAGGAFYYCDGLTSVTIPNSVTSIGRSAFNSCRSLTSITIPNSVTSIGDYAFGDCTGLTSVTILNSVTSIGEMAFVRCSGLTSVYVWAEVPPTLGTDVFYNVSTTIPVYVPCGSAYAYQSAEGWNKSTTIQELLVIYSIEVGVNDSIMGTSQVDYNKCEGAQISATPNYGYHFVQWSDGNTDNPRTLELTQDTILTAEFAQSFSGQCGDNLYWSFNDKTLTITGFGAMWNERPWGLFVDEIQHVVLPNAITHIGDDAFSDCTGLNEITIPYTVTSIGDYAFAGCRKLVHVNCYAINPPMAETTSFANYNAYLNVPCDNLQDYQLDMVFGSFKYIQCMEADSENVPTDDVVVTPGTNDVTITWPTDENADTYKIEIKRGDVVFCTLTFNKDGMLLNIAFAPSRSGSHPVTYAASTGNGLRFTVTSLEESTTYSYDITTKDEEEKILSTYTGEFTTKSNVSTSVSDIQSPMTDCQKLLRNGQLIILRDGVEYNAQGQIVKE